MENLPIAMGGRHFFIVSASLAPELRAIKLYLSLKETLSPGETEHVIGYQIKRYPDAVAPEEDGSCVIGMNEGQRLMDDLFFCGLRPTKAQGEDRTIAAMQAHIDSLTHEIMHLRRLTMPKG